MDLNIALGWATGMTVEEASMYNAEYLRNQERLAWIDTEDFKKEELERLLRLFQYKPAYKPKDHKE